VFFPGSASRNDYRPLLDSAPNLATAVKEIAAVRRAGAPVLEIRELVLQAGSGEESARSAWHLLAGSGEEDARWVMEHYPGELLDVAYALLEQVPAAVIPRLLERAAEEVRARERESRALGLLRSWIQEPHTAQVNEALFRRERVAHAAKRFLTEGGDLGTGVHGISLALIPNQKWSSRDAGLGLTVKLWSALLPADGLRRITQLWEEVKGAIPALDRAALQHLESILWDWMHPSHPVMGAEVSSEAEREMAAFALRALQDLLPLAQSSPGLRARLTRLAGQLGETLPVELDPIFELLYPESYVETEPAREAARQEALCELAGEWARLGPRGVADLALGWLRARLRDTDLPTSFLAGPFAAAVQALGSEQRAELLGDLPVVPVLRSLLPRLVVRDAGLYLRLLARADLAEFHLVPLGGKPDEAWTELALLALEAGYSPERIASAAVWGADGHFYRGPGVEYWEGWAQAFAPLEDHSRSDVREIGRHGRELIDSYLQRARTEPEQVALHGI
jgi:hypothetical protein